MLEKKLIPVPKEIDVKFCFLGGKRMRRPQRGPFRKGGTTRVKIETPGTPELGVGGCPPWVLPQIFAAKEESRFQVSIAGRGAGLGLHPFKGEVTREC